ncbi:MAG: hypothetical protein A2499_14825 [Stygiobacter sp. RIFOXYC12_FULL_38_8]|nr:MAG: hypothetical protein A2279_01090 [Stygiobacter sp. RIFOXYA12_FULL_38_9]OGV07847.1 MAG: hypothetical protein A2299_06745 [Stygiobacter sp. RIFOXYB2_FULL_37_11]OGV11711.1 MAG: hypothetical protein A2237_18200 [Stygiobacter sp. RIFOXYA2_FULL_38_8]OGV12850.1 MAG: hypothetical protein A2440_16580 [Stygiobacter sp. RIFOXYC2_FULL_38_25]OGV27107.1 MAG: hypothetical protein A2499_14825 [Stygiobacter sp. RIFOXYC12_FULL_38_8]OGV81893.1 MAG: hypothetical protein A2X65_13670 [Stygiobacter sp. GWF2_
MKSVLVFVLAVVLLTLSCKDTVAPFESEHSLKNGKKLYIADGYYKKIDTGSSKWLEYYYEFSYFTLEECVHNGYGLKYDSTTEVVFWWASLSLKANTLYHITDTIRTSTEIKSNPTVFLFGYKDGSTANDSTFSAKYTFLPKK